jgi:hypothetical protein
MLTSYTQGVLIMPITAGNAPPSQLVREALPAWAQRAFL